MNVFTDEIQMNILISFSLFKTVTQYQITKESATWKKLFSELNSLKAKFPALESFSASSTSLEQIFIHFSKE